MPPSNFYRDNLGRPIADQFFDPLDFLLLDGTRPMVGNLDFGGWRGINLSDPIFLQDAVNLNWALSNIGVMANAYYVLNQIQLMLEAIPDVTLTTSGAADLQTAITALLDGQLLEVKTNATYSPITLPAGKAFKVRVASGYKPRISGTNCITLANSAANIIFSGFLINTYTTGDTNSLGAGICLQHQGVVNDIIFHNITFDEVTAGSAVMLSYHQTIGGDTYNAPVALAEMSNRVSFVNCNFYKACKDGVEGAALALRGINCALVHGCFINGANLISRGIQLQDSINALVENNEVKNIAGVNGKGILLDELGAIVGYRNSWICRYNKVTIATQGIDNDDNCNVWVYGNTISQCSIDGIHLKGNSRGVFENNIVYGCLYGFHTEVGAICELKNNDSFANIGNNYYMENGYVPDASNLSTNELGIEVPFILQTTDAIPTDMIKLPVAEGEVWNLEVNIEAQKNDNTDRALYHIQGLFYRPVSGNIILEGAVVSLVTIISDITPGVWLADLYADIVNQTMNVRVTGKLATIINWASKVKYNSIISALYPSIPEYGFYGGGDTGLLSDVIDYINLSLIVGNAIDRGDLTIARYGLAGVSGTTYGFYGGGYTGLLSDVIDYINLSLIVGNATDRGDLTIARYGLAGVSGTTYGFYGGGIVPPFPSSTIDYIDLSLIVGNAINRGYTYTAKGYLAGVSGSIYGFYGGGDLGGWTNVIEYIDLSLIVGNGLDRGDLTVSRGYLAGVSGSTYGFYGGGGTAIPFNIIDYIDLSLIVGNAIDRGDLTVARRYLAGASGTTYGFYGGGNTAIGGGPASYNDVIDYINLSLIVGNAIDRGDITIARQRLAGVNG